MASKKKNKATTGGNVTTLKIGSRIRCIDDGMTGRITWANGVSVKIKWDDGEQVTWKREALASKPIEIIDADDEQPTTAVTTELPEEEQPDMLGFDQYGAPYQAPALTEHTATEPQAPATEPTT